MRTAIALLAVLSLVGVATPAATGSHNRGHSARLVARARRGDRLARATVVEEHMGLVRALAWRYQGLGLPTEDLVQEGAIGLLGAVDDYDSGRGATFSVYAYWRIRAAMTHALTSKGSVIRLPRRARERGQRVVSVPIDQPLADGVSPGDRLADDPASRPDACTQREFAAREVRAAVRRLGPRQRVIVSRHFGIGQEPETLAEIAADLRLSPSRAQALKARALEKLASALADAV